MSRSPVDYLRHILDEANYLITESRSLSHAAFIADETRKRAFVRSLEVMGEAVKQVSGDLKQKYPEVEWRSVAGMRDKLIHHYFGVDYDIVWDAVVNKVPTLRDQIRTIISEEFP